MKSEVLVLLNYRQYEIQTLNQQLYFGCKFWTYTLYPGTDANDVHFTEYGPCSVFAVPKVVIMYSRLTVSRLAYCKIVSSFHFITN